MLAPLVMRTTAYLGVLLLVPAVASASPDLVATGVDAITTPGHEVTVRVRVELPGIRSKPAANEPVTISVLGETRWVRTDANGLAATTVKPSSPGVTYIESHVVREPAVVGRARLFVLDSKKPVAVVDVDQTLSDMASWRVPLSGEKADTFPGAPDVLSDLARTHQVV